MSLKDIKAQYNQIMLNNRIKYKYDFENMINKLFPYEFHNYENGTYYTIVFYNVPTDWKILNFYYNENDKIWYHPYVKNKLEDLLNKHNCFEKFNFLLEELDIQYTELSRYADFD